MVQCFPETIGPLGRVRRAQGTPVQRDPEVGQVHRELRVARVSRAYGVVEGVDGLPHIGVDGVPQVGVGGGTQLGVHGVPQAGADAVPVPAGAGQESRTEVRVEQGEGPGRRPHGLGGARDGLVEDGVRARGPGLAERVEGAAEVAVVHPPVRVTRVRRGHRTPPRLHRLVQVDLVSAQHIAIP